MSFINAKVYAIESEETLHIVTFACGTVFLKMMSLELSPDIRIATEVKLQLKATSIALAKNLTGEVSTSNQITCQVESIERGKLLTSLIVTAKQLRLESIVSTTDIERLSLSVGENVTALFSASDLSIAEVL